MIKVLKYRDIDFDKYTESFQNSAQRKYSAEKEFLDITSNKNWDLLVYGDYEAVMPLPFVKRFGVKFIANPKLCQQLGIFSKNDLVKRNDEIFNYFKTNYNIIYYGFNDSNFFTTTLPQRKNYLLNPDTYDKIRQNYSPKRKRKLCIDDEKSNLISFSPNVDFAEAKIFIEKNILGAAKAEDEKDFIEILDQFFKAKKLEFYGFYFENRLVNLISIFVDKKSVALLGTFNDKEFIKLNGSSFLIDKAIEANIDTKIFDFEGSEIPSVEEFFRGFRPELKPYSIISNSKKEILENLFRR